MTIDLSRTGAVSDERAAEQEAEVTAVYAGKSETPICDAEKRWASWNGEDNKFQCVDLCIAEALEKETARLKKANSAGYKLTAALLALPTHEIKRVDYIIRANILDAVYKWRTEVDALLSPASTADRAGK